MTEIIDGQEAKRLLYIVVFLSLYLNHTPASDLKGFDLNINH